MKAMREGKLTTQTTGVVRVLKKEKNIEEDFAATRLLRQKFLQKELKILVCLQEVEKALKEAGVNTDDIAGKDKEELLSIKGIGEKAVEEILKAIKIILLDKYYYGYIN